MLTGKPAWLGMVLPCFYVRNSG